MKMKDMILVSLGAGSVLMYQKYSKPAMKKIKKMLDKTEAL